jgi:predicted HicB family RNase H-like nuclease
MGKSKYGTSGGVELTDDLIEHLVEEAEEGYDAEQLRPRSRRGRPPIGSEAAALFQVRLEPELREALATAARGEHTSPSEMTRRALRTYLQEIEVSPESKGEPRKARQSGLRNRGVRVERWRRSDPRVRGPCRSWVSLISEYSCAGLILLERELSFLD